jgi:hypothetical protein
MTKRFLVPISTDHVDFQLVNSFANATGRLRWDSEEGTLDLGMNGDVVQSIGMEFFMPPTKNNSGVEIPNGSFVMATGAQGDRITIAKAVTNGSVDPMFMIGVSSQTIVDGSETGLITVNGTIRDIDTSLWPVGTVLYPDPNTAGGLVSTKPDSPNIRTPMAIVLRQHAETGRIYVRMTNGSTFGGTDSNVKFENLQDGQTVSYDGTQGIWKNTTPSAKADVSSSFPSNPSDGDTLFYYPDLTFHVAFGGAWMQVGSYYSLDGGTSSTSIFAGSLDGGASDSTYSQALDGGDSQEEQIELLA